MRLKPSFTAEEKATLQEPSLGWGGGWGGHAILNYEYVLNHGVTGLTDYVQRHLSIAEETGAAEATLGWYRGLLHVCAGIGTFISNHVARARELAAEAQDEADRAHYQEISEICEHLTTGPARDLREAVQLLWFIHVLDRTDSPGRLDQYLLPWYELLPGDAEARYAAAYPVMAALWESFIACRSWNVCLAGQTADGRDATNELTWLCLDLQEKYRREAPNLTVRFFAGSPPRLMQRCVQVIATGCGLPALYNDEVMVPALCDLGVPLEDARNYAMNGCNQVDIQGLSHMGLEDGELNLAKCLELALHGGMSPITGRQAGAKTLPAEEIRDFDTLKDQVWAQIRHATALLTRKANVFQQAIAESAPHLYRSLFLGQCVERGLDMKRGGCLYNHGQFLTEGIANTADSLYTLGRLVFEEGRYSLPEFIAILDADWVGHEALLAEVTERFPKYGNDVPEVDALASEAVECFFRALNTHRTWRGGTYSGGLSVFVRAPEYGRDLAAGADGRRKGQLVADSCGPSAGRDRSGPTAMLLSAARLPHRLATSGFCLNMKFSPTVFEGDKAAGVAKVGDLFDTYFHLGGQQLMVNVVDVATLRAAQADPDAYRNLVVRVGGFCARFVTLDPILQEDIIARTTHMT